MLTVTCLFVRGEDGESGSGRLVLVRCLKGPESDGSATELGEPALELTLSSVMRQPTHVQHLASLSQKGANISSGVKRTSQDVRVVLRWL